MPSLVVCIFHLTIYWKNKINILLNLGITLFGGWFGVGPLLSRGGLLFFGFTGSHNFFYFTFQFLLLLGVHCFCNFRVADIKNALYKTHTEDIADKWNCNHNFCQSQIILNHVSMNNSVQIDSFPGFSSIISLIYILQVMTYRH